MKKNLVFLFLLAFIIIFIIGILIGVEFAPREAVSEKAEKEISAEEKQIKQTKMSLAAVDSSGKGVTADLIAEIRPGNGLVLVNINDLLADFYTQYSARIAAMVAGNYTNTSLENFDISYNIKANASVIGGPSAGSAMAIATIAALQNKSLNPQVMITGTIAENGEIKEAGAIVEKAKAAKANNATLFLVPSGLGSEISKYKEEKSCGTYNGIEYCEIKYKAEKVSIGKDIGIEIKEVKNIGEALQYFYEI